MRLAEEGFIRKEEGKSLSSPFRNDSQTPLTAEQTLLGSASPRRRLLPPVLCLTEEKSNKIAR